MSQNQQELGFTPKESLFSKYALYAVIGVFATSIIIFFSNRALGEEEFEFSEKVLLSQEDVTLASDDLRTQEEIESQAYQNLVIAQAVYDQEALNSRSQQQILCNYVENTSKLMYTELEPYMTEEMTTLHDIAEEARECKEGYTAPSFF